MKCGRPKKTFILCGDGFQKIGTFNELCRFLNISYDCLRMINKRNGKVKINNQVMWIDELFEGD